MVYGEELGEIFGELESRFLYVFEMHSGYCLGQTFKLSRVKTARVG